MEKTIQRFHCTIVKMEISILFHVILNSQLNRDYFTRCYIVRYICSNSNPFFRVLPSFPRFTLFSAFYPLFRVLPFFPRFTFFSAFYPFFRVLPSIPRFTLFSASAIPPFRFRVLRLPVDEISFQFRLIQISSKRQETLYIPV